LKTPAVYPQITRIAQIEERPRLNKSVKSVQSADHFSNARAKAAALKRCALALQSAGSDGF
jgi:hypothetical protein